MRLGFRLGCMLLAAAMSLVQPALAKDGQDAMARHTLHLVDSTRGIKASGGFAGADTRRIDVKVWMPRAPQAGPLPLIVYSHGTFGRADNAMYLVRALVGAGYIVAAPDFPLTSRAAFTKIRFADTSDLAEQVADVSLVIDGILADPAFGPLVDADRIGVTGHSLGAITSYFASFGAETRDPRIKAAVLTGAGDPVTAASVGDLGIAVAEAGEVGKVEGSVPVLFLAGGKDVFARMTGGSGAAFARLSAPRYRLVIARGNHIWFRDGNEHPADHKNPDCHFFEKWAPKMSVPGCEERVPLIGPQRQQAITRMATVAFFDAYLKGSMDALATLKGLEGSGDGEVTLTSDAP